MHPAAFPNTWASDYGERYASTEMEGCSCHHGRSRSFHGAHEWPAATGYSHQQQQQQKQKQPPPPCTGASSSSIWQQHAALASDVIKYHHHHDHHLPTEDLRLGASRHGPSSRGGPAGMFGCSGEPMNRDSPASLQSSSSDLYDSTTTVGGWQQFLDLPVRYPSLLVPSPCSPTATASLQQRQLENVHTDSLNEGYIIRELIGRLGGGNVGRSNGDNCSSLTPACPSQHSAGGGLEDLAITVGKLGGGGGNHSSCSWNNSANLTAAVAEIAQGKMGCSFAVDPSKGQLSLNGVGGASGLRTSHNCLRVSPFTADPGFAERAARFSSFGNHNGSYAQSSSPAGPAECGGATRTRNRSSACNLSQQSSSKNPSGVASAPPITHKSAGGSVLNSGTNSGPDKLESAIHSGGGEPLSYDVDLRASTGSGEDHDDYQPDDNYYLRVREKVLSSTGSKTSRKTHPQDLTAEGDKQGQFQREEDEDRQVNPVQDGTMASPSTDHASSNPSRTGKRILSSNIHEPASPAGNREPCPSPCGSGATDVSANKRKITSFERQPTKDVGSMSAASSHDEKDTKIITSANVKRVRRGDGSNDKVEMRSKMERSSSETSGETSPKSSKEQTKPSEPPKPDYIHVRARRGQATDSHSLAERVRREKISERMKFLQDLVPGCNKVTGKAVMLDEIINYVQSLQRQVEFLSMKLASVNPRLDVNLENLLAQEQDLHTTLQSFGSSGDTIQGISYPPVHPPQLQSQLQQALDYQPHSETRLLREMRLVPPPVGIPLRLDALQNEDVRQTSLWDDGGLQRIVQMGHGHLTSSSSPALH